MANFLVDTASTTSYRIQLLIIVFSTILTLAPLTSGPDFLPVLQFTADQSINKAWTPDLLYGSAGPLPETFYGSWCREMPWETADCVRIYKEFYKKLTSVPVLWLFFLNNTGHNLLSLCKTSSEIAEPNVFYWKHFTSINLCLYIFLLFLHNRK